MEVLTASVNKQNICHGVANIDEIYNEFFFHFDASGVTSKYAKFIIYPERRKGKGSKATILIRYKMSACWLACGNDAFAEWLNERRYYEDVKEVDLSMRWKLLDSNIKECFSFFVKIEDLISINRYTDEIFRHRLPLAKPEIYIEIDLSNSRLIINKKLEIDIFKVETCEDKK